MNKKDKAEQTKAEFDKNKIADFKKYVEGKFREYTEKYFIIDFVNLHFHYNLNPDEILLDKEMGGELVFNFDYSHPYRQCHINVHRLALDMWDRGQQNDLEGGILHELSHLHTHQLTELARNRFISEKELMQANEGLTQLISEYVRRIKLLMEENINLKVEPKNKEQKTKNNDSKNK